MLLAMTVVIGLAGKSLLKGLISAAIGLLITTIGLDAVTGAARFTFGSLSLLNGFDFVAASIGLFAVSEVLINAESGIRSVAIEKVTSLYPSWSDIRKTIPTMLRATGIGFFLGLLPGVSPSVTAFLSYDVEKRLSKEPWRFGKGALEGVAGPEGANNATTSGGFIPLMAFGIPPSPALAVLLGAFLMYGLQPGPTLFQQRPDVAWGLIGSMYIGNVMLLVLNLPLVRLWVKLLDVPYLILAPIILILSFVGAFGLRNNFFDLWTVVIFGFLGYLMRKLEVPTAPMVLALILGPRIENLYRQSLSLSVGDVSIFFSGPVALTLVVLIVLSVAFSLWQRTRREGAQIPLAEEL
jgi:putative tricarboxylic transport membrane protein